MRPVSVRQSALGYTQWIPMNRLQKVVNVGQAVNLSTDATLTYRVEHTLDDIYQKSTEFDLTRTGSMATVTMPSLHGLRFGDWVCITGAGVPFDGMYSVGSTPTPTSFNYTVAAVGPTVAPNSKIIQRARIFPHAVLVDLTASKDSNYAFPCTASRLNVTIFTAGFADYTVLQGN